MITVVGSSGVVEAGGVEVAVEAGADGVIEEAAAEKLQTIILKEGCWVKTGTGFRRLRQRLETQATPILAGGEVVGFRFDNPLHRGVSRDLEKIIVGEKAEK